MVEDVEMKAIITEGNKTTRKIITGKHYTEKEMRELENEKWDKVRE